MNDRSRISALYTGTAAFYDEIAAERQAQGKLLALRMLNRQPGERVLEVGAGTGLAFKRLVQSTGVTRAYATDLTLGMLEVARERLHSTGLRPPLIVADATSLPFATGSFDCLLCTHTLEVMAEAAIQAALVEFHRVIKPEGRAVIANLTYGESLVDRKVSQAWQQRFAKDPESVSGARPVRLVSAVEASGFAVKQRKYSGWGLGWPTELILATRGNSGK